jgi:type IV pilus biogenesis protein CpaD/CtpE
MKNFHKILLSLPLCLLAGCASVDAQDRFLLGAANKANIAAQSERSVDLPNSKKVESTSGVRAVAAVKALNDGQTKELANTGTGGAE